MKNYLLLILSVLSLNFIAQVSCNQTSLTPTQIFYPNSTTTFSSNATQNLYLCGSNTVVYDTAVYLDCRYVMVNAGCHYIFNLPNGCTLNSDVYAKNNSTVTVYQGVATAGVRIIKEPLATIITPTSITLTTYTCSSITFPTVNCFSGINEYKNQVNLFKLWPNPASNEINLELINNQAEKSEVFIFNQVGQLVLAERNFDKNKILINDLLNGIYYLTVKQKEFSETKKIVVIR